MAIEGRWRTSPGAWSASYAGVLRVERWRVQHEWRVPRLASVRGGAAARLHQSFGAHGALASGLVLSRKEGLDPDLREAFARSGPAHLLAISGFHVGVVAGLLLALLRAVRLGAGRALLVGAGGVWGYVMVIGASDAAVRAAILLSLAGVARAVGRPLAAEGGGGAGRGLPHPRPARSGRAGPVWVPGLLRRRRRDRPLGPAAGRAPPGRMGAAAIDPEERPRRRGGSGP